MKSIIITFVLIIISLLTRAQNNTFNHIHIDPHLANTAASGMHNNWKSTMGYRNQWVNIEGAPSSYYLNLNGAFHITDITSMFETSYMNKKQILKENRRLYKKRNMNDFVFKHTAGLIIANEKTGAFTFTNIKMSYAVHFPFNGLEIALGTGVNYNQSKLDPKKVKLLDQNDLTYQNYLNNGATSNHFDADFGIFIYKKSWFIGYETNKLTNGAISKSEFEIKNEDKENIITGAIFRMTEIFEFNTNVQYLQTNGIPGTLNLNVIATYRDQFSFGMGYRLKSAGIIYLGCNFEKLLSVNYSYDFQMSDYNEPTAGSHEISINISLQKPGKDQ